jgi:hypothetical protein
LEDLLRAAAGEVPQEHNYKTQMTTEHYEPKGLHFNDLQGKQFLFVQHGEWTGWICYKHPDWSMGIAAHGQPGGHRSHYRDDSGEQLNEKESVT